MAKNNNALQLDLEDAIKRAKQRRASAIQEHVKGRPLHEGYEMPDPVPLEPPVGWFKQPSMFDYMRDMIRSNDLRRAALAAGAETFEEADDFDTGEDLDPSSPYEQDFDPTPISELRRRAQEDHDRRKAGDTPPSPVPGSPSPPPSNPPADGPSPSKPAGERQEGP